jgi:hypothetical protein
MLVMLVAAAKTWGVKAGTSIDPVCLFYQPTCLDLCPQLGLAFVEEFYGKLISLFYWLSMDSIFASKGSKHPPFTIE